MTLYNAETASIVVTDTNNTSINNGTGLPVTVGPAGAASFSLTAASTTPTAGVGDALTITAKDAYGNTATGYAGSKSLKFTGANPSPNATSPTVSDSGNIARTF